MITDPWWWETAPRTAPTFETLPEACDVAVIGAGFTGMSAALTLARAGRDVCVLEVQVPGFGGSTRNGGMIGSGHKVGYGELSAKYGEHVAEEVLREGLRALEFSTGFIKDENIDCDYVNTGRFRTAWKLKNYEALAKEVEFLSKKIGVKADMVPRSEQHREVVTDSYHGGCIFHSHGGLNPAKFYDGIAENALNAGARVFAKSPVISIQKITNGFMVQTPKGKIKARDVIMATNGYTTNVAPDLHRRVTPISSYMIATEPLAKERVRSLIPGLKMIVETRSRTCYYRPSPDGERILLGGRAALRTERRS